jgi:hypothetical protein
MAGERLVTWRQLVEHAEDPFDRADQEMMMRAECSGAWISPLADCEDRDMWRRVLAASVQPLPAAAD